jgi:hypothetical protein
MSEKEEQPKGSGGPVEGKDSSGGNPDRKRQSVRVTSPQHPSVETLLEADEKLVDVLLTRLGDMWGAERNCPYCEVSRWTVATELVKIPTLRDQGKLPYFAVSCANCGNTVLIDAETVDLWPQERG